MKLDAISPSRPSIFKSNVLEEYTELLNDEEDMVRVAAFENFVALMRTCCGQSVEKSLSEFPSRLSASTAAPTNPIHPSLFDNETIVGVVIPMWKKLCVEKNAQLTPILCHNFGAFLWITRQWVAEEEFDWFVEWFMKVALQSKESDLRTMCAFNLPV